VTYDSRLIVADVTISGYVISLVKSGLNLNWHERIDADSPIDTTSRIHTGLEIMLPAPTL
jgi:hypothetical protein